jgi:hypothetical protein
VAYWGNQSKHLQVEALASKEAQLKRQREQYSVSVERTHDEWAEREYVRASQQIEGPDSGMEEYLPGKRFPLFGRYGRNTDPHGQGSELIASAGKLDEEFIPFVDNPDVHVFSSEMSAQSLQYESKAIDAQEQAAEIAKTQLLYDALQKESTQLSQAMERMCQMRESCERDIYQLQQELAVVSLAQEAPIKRLPHASEIESTHQRKERTTLLQRRIIDLQYSINISDQRKRNAEVQMLSLAKKLATGRQQKKTMEKELKSINGEFGTLPMIVGRSIVNAPGLNNQTGKPLETLHAVTQQSKFVSLREMSKATMKVHKERTALDQQLWVTRQDGYEVRGDADRVMRYSERSGTTDTDVCSHECGLYY